MKPFVLPVAWLQAARQSADQSVTSSTAMVNSIDLSFGVGPLEEWIATLWLDVGAALATTGLKVAMNAPSGATINFAAALTPDILAALNLGARRTTTIATELDYVSATQVGVGNAVVACQFWILAGATAGACNLQFAQSTSSGTAVTLRKGSFLTAQRVA